VRGFRSGLLWCGRWWLRNRFKSWIGPEVCRFCVPLGVAGWSGALGIVILAAGIASLKWGPLPLPGAGVVGGGGCC